MERIPSVKFKTRVRDKDSNESNPYVWKDISTEDYFKDKKIILFSLPGAFTPTCSTYQLPNFEKLYSKFLDYGIDDIYCMSVNDAFVMNAWAKQQCVERVTVIPDGSGNFTRFMGMLIGKNHLGFGNRSWRYMAIVNDGVVEKWWQEPGINNDGVDDDPYIESTPENCMEYLQSSN